MYETVSRLVNGQQWIERMVPPLQESARDIVKTIGDGSVKNVLNGTWLGHPLHPVLTDVPVGAWVATAVLDTVGSLSQESGIEKAADMVLATGFAASLGAALTGVTDWSDTHGKSAKVGLLHGLTMLATTLLYGGSLLARGMDHRKSGIALSTCGLGLLTAGAYLGGDEVFDIGYGVNHTAFEGRLSEFCEVIPESELEIGKPVRVEASGSPVVVVKTADGIYALSDTCVHAGCSLAGGEVRGMSIICPCHGSQYRLDTGAVMNGPATRPEPQYDVRTANNMVSVKTSAHSL